MKISLLALPLMLCLETGAQTSLYTSSGTVSGTTSTGAVELVGFGQFIRNPYSGGYSTFRLYNDQNNALRTLEIDYSGSGYSSSLLGGGPNGESAAITTTGAYPLSLGTNNTSRLTILSGGYVGIGTPIPADQLEVVNADRKVGVNTVTGVASGGIISLSRPGDGMKSMWIGTSAAPSADGVIRNSGGGTELRFVSDGGAYSEAGFGFYNNIGIELAFGGTKPSSPAMKIDGLGKVGIGTATPATWLDIKTNSAPQLYLSTSRTFSTSRNWGIGTNWNAEGDFSIIESTGFDNNPSVTRFLIDVSGNVGIGTNSPDAKLAVKGTIHAEEVKVDLNVPGPDYVFEPNYKLLSLEEIKAYIDQHKHLPEVPSAKEMETNGVNLSEMNMLLLKKIEELTLYVIELKKENEQQNHKNEELQKRVIQLENK